MAEPRIQFLKPVDEHFGIQHFSHDSFFGKKRNGGPDRPDGFYSSTGRTADSIMNKMYISGMLGPVNAAKYKSISCWRNF